jgi:hypothetical protein
VPEHTGDARVARFWPAVGELPHRSSSKKTGAQDLVRLIEATEGLGVDLDREEAYPWFGSISMLFDALDVYAVLGRRSRERILAAHDLPEVVAVRVAELWEAGWLPDLAGVHVHSRTERTLLEKGTPGVTVHPDGTKTVTYVFASLSGGSLEAPYSLPVRAEPACQPTDPKALALQAMTMACEARDVLRREMPKAGSLPLIGGTVCPAQVTLDDGRIVGDPLALGDVAEVVQTLQHQQIPMVMHAMVGPAGDLEAPSNVFLDLTPTAGPDAERPGACAGITVLIRKDIPAQLLVAHRTVAHHMFVKVPVRVPGTTAWCSTGGVVYDLADATQLVLCAATYSGVNAPGIAVTNIERSPIGLHRLALALDALFSVERGDCRDRVGDLFMSMYNISATTPVGAKAVAAIGMLTMIPTVMRRIPVEI